MELHWRQTDMAWLAFHQDHAEDIANPLSSPVDTPIRELCARLLAISGQRVAVQFEGKGVNWLVDPVLIPNGPVGGYTPPSVLDVDDPMWSGGAALPGGGGRGEAAGD